MKLDFLQKKTAVKGMLGGSSGDALLLTAVKLMTMLLSLVTTRLLSQYLTKYDYGTYSQILLLSSTIASVTILGMMDGMNFFFCGVKDSERREAYVATIYLMQLAVSVLAGIAVMALSAPICSYMDNPALGKLMIFSALLPTLQNLIFISQVLLISVGKAKVLALRNLIISVLKLLTIVFVVLFVRDIRIILIVSSLLDVLQLIVFYFILRKNGCIIRLCRADTSLVGPILKYCIPMAVFVALNTLNRDCDKYIVALFTDTETLAVYANASKALPLDIVMSSFITILLPRLTKLISDREYDKAVDVYKTFLEIACVSTSVLAGALLAAAPQFMELLYSEKYLSGLSVFCIYIVIDMVKFMSVTLLLTAAGRTKTLMLTAIGSVFVNLGLNVLGFRLFGIVGPALATLFVTIVTGLLILHFSARELGRSISSFFDLRFLLKFVLRLAAAIIAFGCLRTLLDRAGVRYFPIIMIICVPYFVLTLLAFGRRLFRDMAKISGNSAAKEVERNEC